MGLHQVEVYYDDGKWKVESGNRTVSSHRKKSAAISKAKTVAKNREQRTGDYVALDIFTKSGSIQNQETYGERGENLFLDF